ncbi:MAG: uroporphyrinogen decarboxylase family protein [Sedimentisphaerales bacterium]|nr:uroporphyrinogen decarboxylase family protein [Sedimentisphaerales bacterium]
MTSKERIYATLAGEPVDRIAVTPIFMAWAAHFIDRSYRDYYLDGDVLVDSQLAVTRAFEIDQISAISDPWREASAYGMQFEYPEQGVGKPAAMLLNGEEGDLAMLKAADLLTAERTAQRIESVRRMAAEIGDTHSVLGWAEGPFAEYADLRGVEAAMFDLIDKPDFFKVAGDAIIENQIHFALAQVDAGADMIGVGDAAASLISPDAYKQFVLPLQQRLFAAIHEAGAAVKLHICGNIVNHIAHMAQSGANIIDVDWMVPLAEARQLAGPYVTLCGNFDPAAVLLQSSPQAVADAANKCIDAAGQRFILMPGCEVPQDTPEENIRAFCPGQGCLITENLKCRR